jgi:pimeloyl-ACP methyl ester carboxylesterase
LTILIPGSDWQLHGGWGPDNALFGYANGALRGSCREDCTHFLFWDPSGNNHAHRIAAAQTLRKMIAAHRFATGEKLNIIAHSHGGNVALAASNLGLAQPIENLITLNKPTLLRDAYKPGRNIENFYNISAARDWIQWAASDAKMPWSFANDENAVNHTIDTSSSNIKPHAALIWDDKFTEVWWQWFQNQQRAKATSEAE